MPLELRHVAVVSQQLTDVLSRIVGRENVISRPEDLLVYECDAYTLEKNLPNVVVLPRSNDEVAEVVRACAAENVPIIPRGAGTSLSGGVLAVEGGVMIVLTRMNRVLEVDNENRRALVEAGCVNAWITNAVKSRGLLYAPDPSSQPACTIGGNVATNSGGPHTLKYGVTTNHVLGFEMVLPDGEMVWLGTTPGGGEDVPGYDLRGAAIGCEGMFGIVTRVLVKLIRAPQAYKTMLGVFEGVPQASKTVSEIIAAGIVPGALEMTRRAGDDGSIDHPGGGGGVSIRLSARCGRGPDRGTGRIQRRAGTPGGASDGDLPREWGAGGASGENRRGAHAAVEIAKAGVRRHWAAESELSDPGWRRAAIKTSGDHGFHWRDERTIWVAHPECVSRGRWKYSSARAL
jgi:FAD/FMN-containing dehydrogenase